MVTRKVPQEAVEQSQDRPFAALVLDAKAVAQITGSFSLTWPALVQRNQTATSARYREVQWSPPIDQANIEMNMPVQAGAEWSIQGDYDKLRA